MTEEKKPYQEVTVYCSSDKAVDVEAMGHTFPEHFGVPSTDGTMESAILGSRDPALLRFREGVEPTSFVIRALTTSELQYCEAPERYTDKCLRAFRFALVSAELRPGLATSAIVWQPVRSSGAEPLDNAAFEDLRERVGKEAVIEIGSVALHRTQLGPFFEPRYLLPADSLLAQMRTRQSRAVILAREKSGTKDTAAP